MVSIIIVHYKVEKELIACISSILKSNVKEPYEIIVVDNDEKKTIDIDLKKKFPEVKYVPAKINLGFGGGNNLGALHSRGEFLFFLNPDTIVKEHAIDRLVEFLETHKKAGIVAPIFLDSKEKVYPSQGSEELTPLSAIFSLSFINKLLPSNPISKRYFLSNWNKKNPRKVDNVPGTSFLIRENLFEKVGKFDENFFLYFEEFDLCKRVRELRYDLFILPSSQIIHFWGVSTNRSPLNIKKIFLESKFYYFKKHYGLFLAVLVQFITGLSKVHLLVAAIIIFSSFLRLYKLQELVPFIGDQGWFYLSARDMLLTGIVPLVGIPSSHPWIHQGPLWTYMLAIALQIGNFHPLSGAYLTAILGVITVVLVYKVGTVLFRRRVGIVAAVLYAASPLAVINSRMAYHTSPIPLFTLLFVLLLFKWIKGCSMCFPFAILILGILYNFELATSVLYFILFLITAYGVWKRKSWARQIFTLRIVIFSFMAFLVPMIPILIYDFQHGFPQTFKFAAWGGYRILGFLGIISTGTSFANNSLEMIDFFANQYKFLIFFESGFVALMIFILSIGWLIKTLAEGIIEKRFGVGNIILLLWALIPVIAFFINKTPSDAYMPILFPAIILVTALFFESLMRMKILRLITITAIGFIVLINIHTLLSNKYFAQPTFIERVKATQMILNYVDDKKYDIVGEGIGSEFESFTMNYKYLTWWLGHSPSKDNMDIMVVISESKNGINIRTINK